MYNGYISIPHDPCTRRRPSRRNVHRDTKVVHDQWTPLRLPPRDKARGALTSVRSNGSLLVGKPFESRKEGRNFSKSFEIFVSRRTRRTRGTVVRWLRRMSCCRRSRDLRSSVISFSYLVNTPVAEKVSFQERSRFVFMTCTFPGNRSVRGNLCFRCVWCEGREKVIGEHCSNFTVVTTAAWNFCRVRLSVWKTG